MPGSGASPRLTFRTCPQSDITHTGTGTSRRHGQHPCIEEGGANLEGLVDLDAAFPPELDGFDGNWGAGAATLANTCQRFSNCSASPRHRQSSNAECVGHRPRWLETSVTLPNDCVFALQQPSLHQLVLCCCPLLDIQLHLQGCCLMKLSNSVGTPPVSVPHRTVAWLTPFIIILSSASA